jgi:hypothetical protein
MKKYPEALVYFKLPEKHQNALLHYYTGVTQYRLKQQTEALQAMNKAVQFADTTTKRTRRCFTTVPWCASGRGTRRAPWLTYSKPRT